MTAYAAAGGRISGTELEQQGRAAWRLMLTDEIAEEAQSIVRLHRLAIEGGDVRASDDWPAWDAKNTTTGYYFR